MCRSQNKQDYLTGGQRKHILMCFQSKAAKKIATHLAVLARPGEQGSQQQAQVGVCWKKQKLGQHLNNWGGWSGVLL